MIPQVFRPYAKFFLGPLMQLVVCGHNGGDGVHLMVVDIVVTVLSWTSVAKPKVPAFSDPSVLEPNLCVLTCLSPVARVTPETKSWPTGCWSS